MVDTVYIKLPNNSIFIVLGSLASWNMTYFDTNFQNKITSCVETNISTYIDIKTKTNEVKPLFEYEFNCIFYNPYSQ